MKYTIIDIETNDLLEDVTKIHCLSYSLFEDSTELEKGSMTNYDTMVNFLLSQETICGHNIIRYDIPVLNKILNISIKARLIDTLALSWYLYPNLLKHGLEHWGDILGVKKPIILDWNNLKVEDYINRCETDVKINSLLLFKQLEHLKILYDNNQNNINNLINYLSFKLDCAREQEEVKCKIDKVLVENSLKELHKIKEEKIKTLVKAMPKLVKYKQVKKPKKPYKADGTLSALGQKWYSLLLENHLPENYSEDIVVKVSEEVGNPSSKTQLKDWLFSLGWKPVTFEYRKNTVGDITAIPQIYVNDEVCSSIKNLYTIEPTLENLDMLSLINHRIGIFESFLSCLDKNSFVKAEIAGITPTFRFKHRKPLVNLAKKFKFYGEKIRGAIIPTDENHLLCGSDMSSLEDTTKQHYMYFFDKNYVEQMRVPGFDPHLDIAVLAGMLTKEQVQDHKDKKADYSEIRNKAKTVNFAGVYGAGPPKIALTTGMPLEQAQKLHRTYWERNKAVKEVANACKIKTISFEGQSQTWLYNSVSSFWCSLRADKDKFSVLNQSSGVFCFDLYIRFIREQGIKIQMQMHDEVMFSFLKGEEKIIKEKLNKAIDKVNTIVKLNVPLGISIEMGDNYANVH